MSDDKRYALVPAESRDLQAWDAPRVSVPDRPHSSGAWLGTRTGIARKDTRYVQQDTEYLNARVGQTNAMTALVQSRIGLARVMTDLAALGEICAAHFLKGRRQRANDLSVHDLKCQTEETTARAALAAAQNNLAAFAPPPPTAPRAASAPATGLTAAEVEELAATMPDISVDARRTLSLLLSGRLREKNT